MTQQPQTDGVKSALFAAERFEQQHYETGPDGSAKELQARPPTRTEPPRCRLFRAFVTAPHESDRAAANGRLATSRLH